MHSKKRNLFNYILIINIFFKKIFYRNKVFIIGTPIHGNIGDQAIIYSENLMFKEKFNIKPIEVESYLMKKNFRIVKKIIGNSTIYVHGGGFLGTLWEEEEEMFRTILREFPNNKIIVLPQTCYFEDISGDFFLESKKIYESHQNMTIFTREKYSYDFIIKNFPKCRVYLVPDIVLYNKEINFNYNRTGVLCCFRRDKEKKLNFESDILNCLINKKISYDFSDTIIAKKVFSFNRKKYIYQKLEQFSKYKIIITDRLHGMVFAYLTKTPCIVIENKSYKVKGLYDWLKECKYIKLYKKETLENDLEELMSKENLSLIKLDDKFKSLYDLIKEDIKYGK